MNASHFVLALLFVALCVLGGHPVLAQEGIIVATCIQPPSQVEVRCDFNASEPGPPFNTVSGIQHWVSVATNGSRIAHETRDDETGSRVYIVSNPDGSGAIVVEDVSPFGEPAISPDGTRIAYSRVNSGELYVRDLETAQVTQIGSNLFGEHIEWAPDGKRLAVLWENRMVAVINADGSGTPTPILELDYPNEQFSAFDWSPAGDEVALMWKNHVEGQDEVVRIPVNGDSPQTIFETPQNVARLRGIEWSPDGETLALHRSEYVSPGQRLESIELLPAEGGSLTRLHGGLQRSEGGTLPWRFGEWLRGFTREEDLVVNDTGDDADTDTEDGVCDADDTETGNQCTLRAAIEEANARAGRDSVSFNIEMPGPHTISVGVALPEVTEPVIIDATTQPGYDSTPLVVVDGGGLDGDGIHLSAGMSVVRGLAVGGFTGAGIRLSGPGEHVVERSFIGVTADGVAPIPNGTGILIDDSQDNLIGGEPTDPETRLGNLVSGNVGAGILMSGAASMGNEVKGNRIGTSADGLQAVPNGGAGVQISGAEENLIGGETDVAGEGAGNLISGNTGEGVRIGDADGSPAGKNRVSGNMIGLDVTGDVELSNESHGIQVRGNAAETIVGGERESARNVVTGNGQFQIWVEDDEANAPVLSVVAENYVGVNRDGTAIFEQTGFGLAIGRDSGSLVTAGVRAVEVRNNLVAGYRNEIVFYGQQSRGALIIGNRVGLLANDDVARDEPAGSGIVILGGSLAEVGRPDEGNTIAGMAVGLTIAADSVTVVANRIGTNPAGTVARPNLIGIDIVSELYDNGFRVFARTGRRNVIGELGATSASDDFANVISANSVTGISIGSILRLNRDPGKSGGGMFRRTGSMVLTSQAASSQESSALTTNAGMNLAAADSNLIVGNYIGVANGGIGDLGNALDGGNLSGGVLIQRGQGNHLLANIIGNNGVGIMLNGTEHPVRGTTIDFNHIGITPRGGQMGTPKPNQTAGILILGATETKIGAPVDGLDRQLTNVIAHNAGRGVLVLLRSSPTEPERRNLFYRNQSRDNELEAISYVDVNTNPGTEIDGIPAEPRLFLATASQNGEAASVYVSSRESADLEIFVSTLCDPSGRGEGEFYAQTAPSAAGQTQRVFFTDLLDRAITEIGEYVTATATVGGVITSEFSVCARIVDEDDTSIEFVEPGRTGIITADNGIQVEIQAAGVGSPGEPAGKGAGMSDEGDLFVARVDGAPVKGPFSGEAATSSDGTLVLPTVVSDNRYWTMTSDGLTDVVFKVCVDISDLPGSNIPGQLVLAMREHLGMPWTPLNSTLDSDDTRLCAEGIESFGEIAISGDSDVNPVPVEPIPDSEIPSTFEVSLYPTPAINTAVLEVGIPERKSARIEVIDLTGRTVAMVFEGNLQPGVERFNLPVSHLSSGIYLVRISGHSFDMTRKLVLAR